MLVFSDLLARGRGLNAFRGMCVFVLVLTSSPGCLKEKDLVLGLKLDLNSSEG